jgi:hypothetical protein
MGPIVTPDTLLRRYRTLVARKYDGSGARKVGRPNTKLDIESLIVRTEQPRVDFRARQVDLLVGAHGLGPLENRRAAVRDLQRIDPLQTMVPCQRERFLERGLRHMATRLGEEDSAARFEDALNLPEEPICIANLMDNSKCQHKVDLESKVGHTEAVRIADSRLDTFSQIGTPRTPHQCGEHLLLNIHTGHSPPRANEFRQGQREESHAGSNLQDVHARANMCSENLLWVLEERSNRAGQEMAHPDGARVVMWCRFCHVTPTPKWSGIVD